jgi:hypothetical protein
MINLKVSCGSFLPPGDFGREIFGLLIFFSRVLVCVPTEAGIISCLCMIIRQRFSIGLTLRDFLRCLSILLLFWQRLPVLLLFDLVLMDFVVLVHLFSTFFIVKILGVKLFCPPRFERAEKDDEQLS